MAIQGSLKIKNRTYAVIECAYEFNQSVDDTGKPVSRPKGGTITFVMPASSDDDLFFYKWMFNKTEINDGTFTFVVYSQHNKRSSKTVMFKNGYCVGLKDYFNDNDSRLMYTTVTISAEEISVGMYDKAKFSNQWKGTSS